MNIKEVVDEYKKREHKNKYIFLDLIDDLLSKYNKSLNTKTYLLVPDPEKETKDTAFEYYFSHKKVMPFSMMYDIKMLSNTFVESAKRLGFTVIHNVLEYKGDGDIYNLLGDKLYGNTLIKSETEKIPNIKKPLTLNIDNYLENPFFPVVFKNETTNRGEDKYLIETKEQLNKIIKLFNLEESKEISLKESFVAQQYIKGVDGVNCSIRVMTTCYGDILGSLLTYNANMVAEKNIKNYGFDTFNPCEYLSDPASEFYLNTKNILSNHCMGGIGMPIDKSTKLSAEEEIIFSLHNIDLTKMELPLKIREDCKIIANHFDKKKGIVIGIDFVYNAPQNTWYYLETNKNPSTDAYKIIMGLETYTKKDVKCLMQIDALFKIVDNILCKENIENKGEKIR